MPDNAWSTCTGLVNDYSPETLGCSIAQPPTTRPNTSLVRTPTSDATAATSSSRKHSATPPEPEDEPQNKRKRNTEAARRYRQRKFDRATELEEALKAMTKERDDLQLKLAKATTEVDVLRDMVGRKKGS